MTNLFYLRDTRSFRHLEEMTIKSSGRKKRFLNTFVLSVDYHLHKKDEVFIRLAPSEGSYYVIPKNVIDLDKDDTFTFTRFDPGEHQFFFSTRMQSVIIVSSLDFTILFRRVTLYQIIDTPWCSVVTL